MDAQNESDLKTVIAETLQFMRVTFTDDFADRLLRDDEENHQLRKQLYSKMFRTLPLTHLFTFVEFMDRLTEYAERDAEAYALEGDKSPLYPKTRTNLDATMKGLWKRVLKPAVERFQKARIEEEEHDKDEEEDSNPYDEMIGAFKRIISTLSAEI